jgi:hypothetical protein
MGLLGRGDVHLDGHHGEAWVATLANHADIDQRRFQPRLHHGLDIVEHQPAPFGERSEAANDFGADRRQRAFERAHVRGFGVELHRPADGKLNAACRHAHGMTTRGNNAQRQVKEVQIARPKTMVGTRGSPRGKATDQRTALRRRACQVKPLKRASSAAGMWKGGDATTLGGVKTRRRIPP